MTNPTTIEEALAALESAQERFGPVGWFHVIRDALESARAQLAERGREAEAWEAIEAWSGRDTTQCGVELFKGAAGWIALPRDGNGDTMCDAMHGLSRLEALTKAAVWCRAHLAERTRNAAAEAGKGQSRVAAAR